MGQRMVDDDVSRDSHIPSHVPFTFDEDDDDGIGKGRALDECCCSVLSQMKSTAVAKFHLLRILETVFFFGKIWCSTLA